MSEQVTVYTDAEFEDLWPTRTFKSLTMSAHDITIERAYIVVHNVGNGYAGKIDAGYWRLEGTISIDRLSQLIAMKDAVCAATEFLQDQRIRP